MTNTKDVTAIEQESKVPTSIALKTADPETLVALQGVLSDNFTTMKVEGVKLHPKDAKKRAVGNPTECHIEDDMLVISVKEQFKENSNDTMYILSRVENNVRNLLSDSFDIKKTSGAQKHSTILELR